MARSQDAVYATLVMTDNYLPGAVVLGHSLRQRGATAKLVAAVVSEWLSPETMTELQKVYDEVVPVGRITNSTPANLYLMNRPDLISTFTKIELWKLTQYKRIVYLDADMVVLKAPNELLTMDTAFAAVPDIGWPDCFNSGMMVFNPNMGDYYALTALANRGISFDGADQGLLNMHFTDWDRLSFVYNCTPSGNYQYLPAYRHFQSGIKAIHFIGMDKPWTLGRSNKYNQGVYGEMLARWWAVYDKHYQRPRVYTYPGQTIPPQKSVSNYVRGEETIYEPAPTYQPIPETSSTYSSQPVRSQPAPVPVTTSASEAHGDGQPAQRDQQWFAPRAEWEPARQPPPPNSKPEAANFPTQQYEFQESKDLFVPPTTYPEPPKDMWYQVPDKPKQEAQLKPIFPWEEHAPRPTRVFPKSREPSPRPRRDSVSSLENLKGSIVAEPHSSPVRFRSDFISLTPADTTRPLPSEPAAPVRPPSPPRHIFPWEAHAPKATRVFSHNTPITTSTPTTSAETITSPEPTPTVKITPAPVTQAASPPQPLKSTWEDFQQRTNAWDDIPEITKYMEGLQKPRKARIQILHHTPTSPGEKGPEPLPIAERRTSLKLTDFPTEIERPSLPVTPAPIRRPSFWGDEREGGPLASADGVPLQEEWNPVAKLEELQRRQSEVLENPAILIERAKTPPVRQMPESSSREEAIAAALKALVMARPKAPAKPILKESRFEATDASEQELLSPNLRVTHSTTATGTKSPTRFNPIVLEGEAASERTSPEEERVTILDDARGMATFEKEINA